MAERIHIDHGNFESAKHQIPTWQVPASVKRELLAFLDDLGLGKVHRGKRLSVARQLKYLYALRAPLEFLNKASDRLTLADIEKLERAFQTGEVRSRLTGRPYAHGTQVDMRILLRIFLRWRLGQAPAAALTDWLDVRIRHKTPQFLTEPEAERLLRNGRDARQRFLIALLFDSGARAEEFHNIRFEDVQMPEGRDSFVRIVLKQEYSKTLGRTIALYWKHSLTAVKEYLAERIAAGIKPTDPVFQGSYDTTRRSLHRLGMRLLDRPVHYHLFRHSSATYYASKLNRQELCYRYGWRFSSNMPDVYISRAGMESRTLDQTFAQTELTALKEDFSKMEQAVKIKDDRIQQLEQSMHALQRNIGAVSTVLGLSPTLSEVQIARDRKAHTKDSGKQSR